MGKISLREICDRLSSSEELEGVVDALLAYLPALQGDWHATLALHDASRDSLVRVWLRERGRLDRRDIQVAVDHLPARLVRKFFRPSAFFNAVERRTLLSKVFRTSPVYEPDTFEAQQLAGITAPVPWHSGVIIPLADQDDLLALLVIVSPRRQAFPAAQIEEVLAIRTMAALAIGRRLQADGRPTPESRSADDHSRRTTAHFQERLRQLEAEAVALHEDNKLKAGRMELLARELDEVRRRAEGEHGELGDVRGRLHALEEQSAAAAAHLNDAYAQLASAQNRMSDLQHTTEFLREVFQTACTEPDENTLARELVRRFCEHFEVERCTLMREDEAHLRVAAHHGIDPAVAGRVRLPIGEGVAGWVARHRKPVLVRERDDAAPVAATGVDHYNSDSFVSVPLVHHNRLLGVLNLSNKRDGEAFDETDLERAQFAGAVLGMALSRRESGRFEVK